MKTLHKLAHLFTPRESNNHKARILHPSGLSLIALFLIFFQLTLSFIPRLGTRVLGYAANISPSEVVALTNQKRQEEGLSSLVINPTLSAAAQAKGADMLSKGYWAHVAPDGTQPWKFFADFGYKYRYAGENLARDFSSASSAVDAWMASPSHRENMLSPRYKEIGIGVVEGDLAGIDTTIVVQFFATSYTDTVPVIPVAKATEVEPSSAPAASSVTNIAPVQASSLTKPVLSISPFTSTKNTSFAIVATLLAVLTLDGIIISRKNVVRVGGRSLAHISFFSMILIVIIILKAGQVI